MSFNDIMQSEELIIILVILVMSLIGSLSKDYINLMKKGIRMKIGRIILSTICSSIIAYTFSAYILDKLLFRGLVGVSYFVGLLGFELVSKFSNLTDVFRMYFLARFGLDPDRLQKIEESLEKLEDKMDERDEEDYEDDNDDNSEVDSSSDPPKKSVVFKEKKDTIVNNSNKYNSLKRPNNRKRH